MRSTLGIRSMVRDESPSNCAKIARSRSLARPCSATCVRWAHLHRTASAGVAGICPGPNLSRRNAAHKVYPYLLRNVTAARPNHVWGVDITYIRLRSGWMYLVAVLDWFSRYVVSWELDQTLEMPFVVATVQRALAQATPVIWNSDQGSHFTSPQYTQLLLNAGVQISMDGKGRALDNIFTERLWRSVKYEEVYLNDYANPKEARRGLAEYLHFYDYHRPHQALNYQTPAAIYYGHTGDRAACVPVVTNNDVRM